MELKLGSRLSKTARNEMADDLLNLLGLSRVADSVVGGPKVRGASGGEGKQLSIAVEKISSPAVLFLNEPTRHSIAALTAEACVVLSSLAFLFSRLSSPCASILPSCSCASESKRTFVHARTLNGV